MVAILFSRFRLSGVPQRGFLLTLTLSAAPARGLLRRFMNLDSWYMPLLRVPRRAFALQCDQPHPPRTPLGLGVRRPLLLAVK